MEHEIQPVTSLLVVLVSFLLIFSLTTVWRRIRILKEKVVELEQHACEIEKVYADAPLGLAMLDRDLRFIRINKLLAEINGMSVEEHIGKTIREVVPALAEQAERPFLKVLRTGKPVSNLMFSGMTASQPGAQRFWRESISPVFAGSGEITGISVSVQEITEEKRLNDSLCESELRGRAHATELEAVMNATPAAIFIAHERSCTNVTGNAEAIRLLRLRAGENPSITAPGIRPFTVYSNGIPLASAQLPLQEAAATGKEVRDVELELHFINGDVTHVLMNAAPLRDQNGNVFGAVAAFSDITAQRRATAMLIREARHKNEFLAILAHELRSPLASIQTGLELMKLAPNISTSRMETCNTMERQVFHLVRLIDDLQDISRISAGKLDIKKETLDVRHIIDRAVQSCRPAIETAGRSLTVETSSKPLYVEADLIRMEQVICNLLNNAAKYTTRGGRIQLVVGVDEENVLIRVIDNGIGIEKEMLAEIFNLFSQAEGARDLRQGGMGIGLFLARQIVGMHGGTLTVQSAGPNLGSTFSLRLPLSTTAKPIL